MNLISDEKVFLQRDRNGDHTEYVQIEVYYTPLPDSQTYRFDVTDYAIINLGEDGETKQILHDFNGAEVRRTYYKTYDEFNNEMEALKEAYPTELKGAYAMDFYVVKGSLFQLIADPIYNMTFSAR